MPFMFEVGKSYMTQEGKMVKVIGRTDKYRGYECLICDDGKHRYDRSDHSSDAGRVTGTAHDYSYPSNFNRMTELDKFQAIGRGLREPKEIRIIDYITLLQPVNAPTLSEKFYQELRELVSKYRIRFK